MLKSKSLKKLTLKTNDVMIKNNIQKSNSTLNSNKTPLNILKMKLIADSLYS